MSQTTFRNSGAPYILPVGYPRQSPVSIEVIPNGGSVVIQLQDGDSGNWYTPTDPAFTLTTKGIERLTRENMPTVRIMATGSALFRVTGQ